MDITYQILIYFWDFLKTIFLWSWIISGMILCCMIFFRQRLLKDIIEWKSFLFLMFFVLCPGVNIITLSANFYDIIQLILNRKQYLKEHLPDVQYKAMQLQQEYSIQYIESLGMMDDFKEYINSKLVMGKLTKGE